jgi:hypothetical protein
MSLVEQNPVGTQVTTDNVSFEWRRQQYEALGFNEPQAIALAKSTETAVTGGKDKNAKKVTWNTPLHWAKVKEALDKGCTHDLAVQIYANGDL